MGAAGREIAERLSVMTIGDASSGESLFQVMKALEYAESTIKQQLEENNRLKDELHQKTLEIGKYRSDTDRYLASIYDGGSRDKHNIVSCNPQILTSSAENVERKIKWKDNGFLEGSHLCPDGSKDYGNSKFPPELDNNLSNCQISPTSSRSLSPNRHRKEGEFDPKINPYGHNLLNSHEITNTSNQWEQDLLLKVRYHEEEITYLKRQLADYSMKEAQIQNEKYVLEKRIAHMRMAFDQQQKELVDAASKALSYRQDVIEENIRLTYALQVAQQEKSTYMSSLLPLLTEYGLQPPVSDAVSIVSNVKVLLKHLHEKFIITEEKLKESQYKIAPWRVESSNLSQVLPHSSSTFSGGEMISQAQDMFHLETNPDPKNTNMLKIVPQPSYSHVHSPIAYTSDTQTRADWDALGHHTLQSGTSGTVTENVDCNIERYSPTKSAESKEKLLMEKDFIKDNYLDDPEVLASKLAKDPSLKWDSGISPNIGPGLDQNLPLSPVIEERGSSFSEAADEDPLPGIDSLQIFGEAFPGKELQACGYSINGTTSCNFEWVRHLVDGSVNYIDGAKQPVYLVTADDVDSYLAIEVQPLDNRKRKGELVKLFANEKAKISCDPQMQEQIERTLLVGFESYEVTVSTGMLNFWEHANLIIKSEGYSIKCNGPWGVMEKFAPNTEISVSYEHPTEFSIHVANQSEHHLRTASSTLRDTIVLTLRFFKIRALQKRKRKGLFKWSKHQKNFFI